MLKVVNGWTRNESSFLNVRSILENALHIEIKDQGRVAVLLKNNSPLAITGTDFEPFIRAMAGELTDTNGIGMLLTQAEAETIIGEYREWKQQEEEKRAGRIRRADEQAAAAQAATQP